MKGLVPLLALAALLVAGCGGSRHAVPLRGPNGTLDVAIRVLKHDRQVIALVPVTIDGKGPYTFALDTGASQSLVDSSVAKELPARTTGSHAVAGISSVTKARSIAVRDWRVGGVPLPPTTIVAENLPFGDAQGGVQGLLGSDMLSRFDVVTIDYAHGVLRLHGRAVTASG